MAEPLIEVRNVTYYYDGNSSARQYAVENVSFDISEGELWGIIGHTGSGKSTLTELMCGLIKPRSGEVVVEGTSLAEKKHAVRELKGKVGLVFQYPEHQLFDETVLKDVSFGPKNLGYSEKESAEMAREAMRLVNLGENFENLSPFELSGGEKRRAAIAGVLAMKPNVLILDEPTAGLDGAGRGELFELLLKIKKMWCRSVVLVSHSMEDVARLCDKVLVMNGGRLFAKGSVKEVFSRRDALRSIGLDVPEITRVAIKLKEMGCGIDENIFSVDEAADAVLRLWEAKKCSRT